MLLRSKLGSSSMTTKDLQIGSRTKFISSALLLSLQTKRLKGSPATDNHVTVQTNNAAALKIPILSVTFFFSPSLSCLHPRLIVLMLSLWVLMFDTAKHS